MKRNGIFLVGAVALLLGGTLVVRKFVERQLIFPGAATQGRADAVIPPSGDYELIPLQTREGTKLVAQFGRAVDAQGFRASDPEARPTVIFFYGNGSCAAYIGGVFNHLRRLGVNVLVPEFPGYGMSEGRPSERGFYEAGDAVYDYALTRADIDRRRIIVAGWSMGAAVVVDLASRRPTLALITVSAFTTLPAVAHALVPWLPTSLLIRSRFDNLAKIPAVSCPILIAHGTRDGLVPPAMARELAAAAKSPVTAYQVAGAGHNDVFAIGGAAFWRALATFLNQQTPAIAYDHPST